MDQKIPKFRGSKNLPPLPNFSLFVPARPLYLLPHPHSCISSSSLAVPSFSYASQIPHKQAQVRCPGMGRRWCLGAGAGLSPQLHFAADAEAPHLRWLRCLSAASLSAAEVAASTALSMAAAASCLAVVSLLIPAETLSPLAASFLLSTHRMNFFYLCSDI